MKQQISFDSVIAKTLMIPLYIREKESRRGEKAIFRDKVSERLVDSLDYDFSKLDQVQLSELGSIVRGWY